MLKLSVIIPVYNGAAYLSRCLESIIYQSYGRQGGWNENLDDIEIIIIDDASTDDSPQICNKYALLDKRVKIIKQENAGTSAARNTGLKNAQGQYIHFIDQDDYLDLNYYEKMLPAALNASADISASGYRQVMDNNRINMFVAYKNSHILTDIESKIRQLNLADYPALWRYLFKRTLIEKHKLSFEVGNFSAEDVNFTIPAVYFSNKVAIVPDVNYNYMYNLNSISFSKDTQKESKRQFWRIKSWEKVRVFAKENNFELKSSPQFDLIKYKLFHSATIMHKKVFSDRIEFYLFGKFRVWTIKIMRNFA